MEKLHIHWTFFQADWLDSFYMVKGTEALHSYWLYMVQTLHSYRLYMVQTLHSSRPIVSLLLECKWINPNPGIMTWLLNLRNLPIPIQRGQKGHFLARFACGRAPKVDVLLRGDSCNFKPPPLFLHGKEVLPNPSLGKRKLISKVVRDGE